MSIGPDGMLYVHMGDGFLPATALDLEDYRGKILRVELDGSAPTDNPFHDADNGITPRDYVFAYGLRNPFGGAWREADALHYQVENGPTRDRFAQVLPGRNFGWDGSNDSTLANALYNWQPAVAPVSIAFVQPGTFGGSGFSPSHQGHAFITESGSTYAPGPQDDGKRISEWVLDADGALIAGPLPFLSYVGEGRGTAIGLAAGPDGLYMTDLYRDEGDDPTATGATVLRISYDRSYDCNGNGQSDGCDIAEGSREDTNGDGVPDECGCAGVPFCHALPNSTGMPAVISANGACAVADAAFVLQAAPVPAEQAGVFFYSSGQAQAGAGLPFMNGFRCVGGGLGVARFEVIQSVGELATYAVNFDLPVPPGLEITPNTTWHFQYWYRDPAGGGAAANLSDALTVRRCYEISGAFRRGIVVCGKAR